MNFIIKSQEVFQTYLSIHDINTGNKHHLHRPNANLSCFQKSTFSTGYHRVQKSSWITEQNVKHPQESTHIHTHCFTPVVKFRMCKGDLEYCFLNVCGILRCKFVWLCIYDLFHKMLSVWHTNVSMVCMCVM